MSFPDQLKAHRKRLGLTQAGLAAVLEVSPRAVWQWEKGEVPHVLTQEGALARMAKPARLAGIKAAQNALGHTTPDTTEGHYLTPEWK